MDKQIKNAIENGESGKRIKGEFFRNYLKDKNGITLIALVITIIVLLILAGVTIATLTGENGILSQAQNAKDKTTLAAMEEELNLVCMDLYTTKAQTGSVDISMSDVYNKLTNDMEVKSHIYPVDGTSTISLVNSTQSSVTLLNDGTAIGSDGEAGKNTVSIEVHEESNSTTYYLEANGKYYPMSIRNLQVALDEENATTTPPTGIGSLGSGITVKFIDSGTSEETDTSSYVEKSVSENTITLTAKVAGSTQVVVKDGDVTLAGNIEVKVNPTYEIKLGTMTNGEIVITTSGKDTTENKKYGSEVEIKLTAKGNQGYAFEKWSDNDSTSNPRTVKITEEAAAVTYTATFVESKLYGAKVQLNGGNAITVKGSNAIEDNWKLFYIDDEADGYVHLIYEDYYPANVQTEITSGNNATIYIPGNDTITNSPMEYSVNTLTNRNKLLAYLKNNSNYSSSSLDDSEPQGIYESWENLKMALTGTGKKLNGKIIKIQGAPNITMWVNSWNEQGYTRLKLKNSGNSTTGYNIMLNTADNNSSYYTDLSKFSGYNDILYFPYQNKTSGNGNADKAWGYWLASPSGKNSSYVCNVDSNGAVRCEYNSIGASYCSRPIVSIKKSDFMSLFPNISITKE